MKTEVSSGRPEEIATHAPVNSPFRPKESNFDSALVAGKGSRLKTNLWPTIYGRRRRGDWSPERLGLRRPSISGDGNVYGWPTGLTILTFTQDDITHSHSKALLLCFDKWPLLYYSILNHLMFHLMLEIKITDIQHNCINDSLSNERLAWINTMNIHDYVMDYYYLVFGHFLRTSSSLCRTASNFCWANLFISISNSF